MSSMRKFIETCFLDAASVIERERRKGLSIKEKGRNDFATSADLASEKLIVDRVKKEYPDSMVLSEESFLKTDLEADSLFVIDPIDGTHNFIWGLPLYGISIAHYSRGRPTAGGVYLIPQKETMYAEIGLQTELNGKKVSVRKTKKLEDFFLISDSRLHLAQEQGIMGGLLALERMSQHTRFIGSAVYEMGYVAAGRIDACFGYKYKPYDFAAGALLVEQAGGKVTDFEGRGWRLETTRFLASNNTQHQRILEVLLGKN